MPSSFFRGKSHSFLDALASLGSLLETQSVINVFEILSNLGHIFRLCSGYVQSVFRMCSEYVPSVFRVSSECHQSVIRVSSECHQSVFRVSSECLQSVFNIEVISSSSASSVSIFGIFPSQSSPSSSFSLLVNHIPSTNIFFLFPLMSLFLL